MIKRECIEPFAQDVSCKLLHLRASGDFLARKDDEWYIKRDEIDDFATWAFGPNGLPELVVLAYGDFTFRDMCEKENFLYCRNVPRGIGTLLPKQNLGFYICTTPNKHEIIGNEGL